MMAFVEQSVWRDDAIEILQRRPSRRGLILWQIFWDIFDNTLLERRRRSIKLASHLIAGRLHPLRNIGREVVGIHCGRHGFAAGETARQNGPTHQCATFAEKTPARRYGNIVVDIGWLGHRTPSVRKRRPYEIDSRKY